MHNRASLLTGGTGFVGGQLIAELLNTTTRSLVCVVRADNHAHAAQRGNQQLAELLGATEAARHVERVRWVPGDLSVERLGWSSTEWTDIAATIDEVFHCAASVSFDLPLDEAHAINVDGTKRVHELAVAAHRAHGDFRRLHHVSTAYVAGLTKGAVDPYFLPNDDEARFRNTYERTKARAERWLHSVANHEVPITIHRPSIIAGHTVTGATTNWNVMYVPMRMVAQGALPVFARGGRQIVDCIGVDFVARSMVAFAAIDSAPLVAHHLTAGPSAITATHVMRRTAELAEAAGGSPSHVKMLSSRQFRALVATVRGVAALPSGLSERVGLGKVRSKCRLAMRAMGKCAVYLPYSAVDTTFSLGDDAELLREFGIEMPQGEAYFDTVCRYALEASFGRAAVTPVDVRESDLDAATDTALAVV